MKYQLLSVLCLIFSLASFAAFAQGTGEVIELQEAVASPPGAASAMPGEEDRFIFISSEFELNKVVKGAPYSAEAVTERVQDLSDGNRIVQRNTAQLYRDGEGRSRREQELGLIGSWSAASKEPARTFFIHDPVSGVDYILDEKEQTARKLKMPKKQGPPVVAGKEKEKEWIAPAPAPAFGERHVFRFYNETKDAKQESLGKQTMEGILVEGIRTVSTIAVGEIGNERPIQIISEKWYSPELQVYIMTKHSDPRFGETTYRLTNISRREPDASLFAPPAGYKVVDTPASGKVIIRKEIKPKKN